jgi:hypothetical protein
LKIRILQDTKILHTSWKGEIRFISLQEGQILDDIGLITDVFDSNLYSINWSKGSFELNRNLFKIIS